MRALIAAELAQLSPADRAIAAEWTPDAARQALGISGPGDPAVTESVSAAMAAAERRAQAVYGTPEVGAA